MNEMQKAARRLHALGFKTLPIKPGTKVPSCPHGVKDATLDDAATDAWYGVHRKDGIAVSGDGFVIFDFDVHDGVDGRDALLGWDLPDTMAQTTPSGGYHMFYKVDEEVRPSVNTQMAVDVRGADSYVVIDPTPGYTLESDDPPAHADGAVMDFLSHVRPKSTRQRTQTKPEDGIVTEGGRNDYLFRVGRSVRAKGFTDDEVAIYMRGVNAANCRPPLPSGEVDKAIASVCSVEPGYSDEVKKAKAGRPRKFAHNAVARDLIDNYGACFLDGMPAIREDGGRYRIGWDAFDAAIIAKYDDCTMANRREVKGYIAARAPHRTQSSPDLIAFANGVLDVSTMGFRDWREDDAIANVIPHDWRPDARSDLLDGTLEKMAAGDLGTLMNLSEFIGICMVRSSRRYPFFPVLIGEGSNGKSTYIAMLQALLGPENISSLQPTVITKRFMGVHIVGKTANLGDDIADGYLDADDCAVIKSIATGDIMFTDVKGNSGFEFNPYCTMVFSCNAFPRLADTTEGFMRRLFPIEFNAKFTKDDPDYDPLIAEKLVGEEVMEAACVLGVEGLRRVIAQNCPTPNPMSEAMKADIAREGNTVLQWIQDEGITAEHLRDMTKTEAYDEYKAWADANGYGRTAVAAGTLVAQIGTLFRLKCTKMAHRGEGMLRKTVRVFE